MKRLYLTVLTLFFILISASAQEHDLFYLYGTKLVNDSTHVMLRTASFETQQLGFFRLQQLLQNKEAGKMTLHQTRKGNAVALHFFPGISDKNALIIGGMHGSELSSIKVAETLIHKLSAGERPYYNVIVIPSLFPDNAQMAREEKGDRIQQNTGRYTTEATADPNRQMPLPGRPFNPEQPFDALGREIEEENQAILRLIQHYKPDRILSIHGIKDRSKAGVFADPRTDCRGNALGFETDKALALLMAQQIQAFGGACPGNNLQEGPTAVYYLDPPVAEAGQQQLRNYQMSNLQGRGRGISMGTWCSTAVCDSDAGRSRPAIRTFTMEFPGNFVPSEYKTTEEQQKAARMIDVYAAAIQQYFLQSFFVEENDNDTGIRFASN
jgi:hypothetical protein